MSSSIQVPEEAQQLDNIVNGKVHPDNPKMNENNKVDEENRPKYLNIYNIHHKIPVLFTVLNFFMKKEINLWLKVIASLISIGAFAIYFVSALRIQTKKDEEDYWCEGDGFLIVNTVFWGTLLLYFQVLKPVYVKFFAAKSIKNQKLFASLRKNRCVSILKYGIPSVLFIIFILWDASEDYSRLMSAFGGLMFLLIAVVFSLYPTQINFGQVFCGISLQIIFGIVILRWNFGKMIFQCLGNKVSSFLSFTDIGVYFALGEFLRDTNSYAFKILPVILYFGMFVSILYQYGIIQWVIVKLGWILETFIGTTPCESMGAAANIFLGQSEAPLVIKPYIDILTNSELHAVMTGGFATVAGGVLAAYISFGVDPAHLLSASIISAPAALVMSKIFYPEIENSQTKSTNIVIIKRRYNNVLQAVMCDMIDNLPLIANITGILLIVMSGAAFLNAVSDWSCQLIGYDEGVCEVQVALGYLLYPVAWLMGVPKEDCFDVGYLFGMKIFVSEFIAYKELMDKFKLGLISARAVTISTYALCGFSSLASIGCQIGALGCMAPKRMKDISTIIVRAFVAGNFACILTACIAGTLVQDSTERLMNFNQTMSL